MSFKGQRHTDEAKRKMAIAAKGRRHSKESRYKIGLASLGRKDSEKTKRLKSEIAKRNGREPPHPTGEDSPLWKGDAVGYGSLHDWANISFRGHKLVNWHSTS